MDSSNHSTPPIHTSDHPSARPWPLSLRIGILVGFALLCVITFPIFKQLSFEEDVTNWLPADDYQAQLLKYQQEHFPADEAVLIAWDGSKLDDPRIEEFAEILRAEKWVTRVATPHDLIERMTKSKVPEEVAQTRLRGLVLGEAKPGEQPPAGLIVTFLDADKQTLQKYMRRLRELGRKVGIPSEELRLGGGSVAGAELDRRLGETRWNAQAPWYRLDQKSPLLLSSVVTLVLAVLLLRQIRLVLLVLGATLVTTYLGVSQLPLMGVHMNMVLTVLPPLLLVLTMSAAIHLANYWRYTSALTETGAVAAAMAQRFAFWPCVLAAITTAIGLASLLTSPLKPVRDFGFYSSTGVLLGLGAALFLLPSALSIIPMGKPRPPGKEAAMWANIGSYVCRNSRWIFSLSLLFGIGISCGLYWFRTETRVISYFPSDSRIVADYEFLEHHLAGITPVDFLVIFDQSAQNEIPMAERIETVRRVEDAIRKHKHVSGTMGLVDFLPNVSDLGLAARGHFVRTRIPRLEASIASDSDPEVRRFVTRAKKPFVDDNNHATIAAGDELWQISAQVQVLSNPNYDDLTQELQNDVSKTLKDEKGASFVLTGTVPLFLRTQQAVLNSLITSFGIAFVVIAITLMVVLGNIPAGLVTMLPNLLPVSVVFGLISWYGIAFDIGMMITASVALGIAVDGTLHQLTWFREGLSAGRSTEEAIRGAISHCGPAMWQTSAIIGFSLLMLAFSDLLLISRFGWLMAALIFAALFADLIFLTALLAGPFGRLIRPSQQEQPAILASEITEPNILASGLEEANEGDADHVETVPEEAHSTHST